MRVSSKLNQEFAAASKDNKITSSEAKAVLKSSLDEVKASKTPAEKLAAVQDKVRDVLSQDHFIQGSTEKKFEEFAKAKTIKGAEAIYNELAGIKSERKKRPTKTGGSGYGGKSGGATTTKPRPGYGGKSTTPSRPHTGGSRT